MKKIYAKYDYIYIYSKLGVITTTFAVVSISLSLFLGFIVTLAGHAHPDLSSRICFVLFVLNLPFVFQKVKRYQAIQNKLKKRHPDDPGNYEFWYESSQMIQKMISLLRLPFPIENSYGEVLFYLLSLLLQYCF